MTNKNEESRAFLVGLIENYKAFIDCTAESLDGLAEIQRKYKNLYEQFKEFQVDPSTIIDMIKHFEKNEIGIILEFVLRMEELSNRMHNILALSSKEQNKLADDLRKFGSDFKKFVVELKKPLGEIK